MSILSRRLVEEERRGEGRWRGNGRYIRGEGRAFPSAGQTERQRKEEGRAK
jgi:hypothetical protein